MAEDATTQDEETVEDQRAPYEQHDGRDFRIRDEHEGDPQDVRDFVGVTDEYKNFANHYGAPMLTDVERFTHTNQYDHLTGNMDEADEEPVAGDFAEAEGKDRSDVEHTPLDASGSAGYVEPEKKAQARDENPSLPPLA